MPKKTISKRIEIPNELHGKFKAKCATEEGNPPMIRKILELMEEWVMLNEINQIGDKK